MLLSSIIASAVQTDWSQATITSPGFIKNKPTLGTASASATGDFDASGAASTAQAAAIQRANHTGTQSADTITDGSTNKAYTATEKTKLTNIRNLGFKLTAVNLNSVSDNAITGLPAKWRPIKLSAFEASTTPGALAVVGLYTAVTGGGTNLISAMTLTGLSAASKITDATLISITDYRTETTVYLRNTVANGSAATASFILFIEDLT